MTSTSGRCPPARSYPSTPAELGDAEALAAGVEPVALEPETTSLSGTPSSAVGTVVMSAVTRRCSTPGSDAVTRVTAGASAGEAIAKRL